MDSHLYTVQASIFGIGWVTFGVTRDSHEAICQEKEAKYADDKRYPGTSPRHTRILTDGKPPEKQPPTSLAEIFA